MPITVLIRSEASGEAPSLTFDGDRVVLGRSVGCDVRLPDPSVSHRHATLRANGAEYSLLDEGSTNGTFVGGIRLEPRTPRIVRSGDKIRVGRVWLEVRIGAQPATPDLGMATRDLAFALVANALASMGDDTTPRVRVVEGPDAGAELRLAEAGRPYVIGRAETCDLPLLDQDCSREHAQIVRRGGAVLLRDAGSKNGVLLGESLVAKGRDVVWRAPQMVRVGATVLALDEPVARALEELEAGPDEKLADADVPPEPEPTPPPAPPNAEAPASVAAIPTGQAPIAAPPSAAPASSPRAPPRRRAWTAIDVLVILIAVSVLALSAAGFVWLLRG
jgi:pSer/pThr/pTyr-binding forkhead associated (FHA) protein